MQKLSFVIGATATGKTYFIEHHFADKRADVLKVYDYQQRAYDEAGCNDWITFDMQFRCLKKANETHLHDIIAELKKGHDVVAEQTFFKAKRRIVYIDEIRRAVDVEIEVFVMHPGDNRWEDNIKMRELDNDLKSFKEQAQRDIEFPNPAEGFDAIYEVVDEDIILRMDEEKPEIVDQARKELAEEAARITKEEEERRKRQELLDSMNTRPFWHYCEVCGRKEFITAEDAHDSGWDYPPKIGMFGLLSPRTCGDCNMQQTLWWKVDQQRIPVVFEGNLTEKEKETWERIKNEPESLLDDEE